MLGDRFERALLFVTQRHADQVRKGTKVPYVSHLLSVAALVIEAGGDEDDAVAALLHDAVEDQKATLSEIGEMFGGPVADVVEQCSDTDEDPKPPWRARKEEFISRIPNLTAGARLVTVADKLHNVRSILVDYRAQGEIVWEKFNGGRAGTLWYYRAVTDALGDQNCSLQNCSLYDELVATVTDLELAARAGSESTPG